MCYEHRLISESHYLKVLTSIYVYQNLKQYNLFYPIGVRKETVNHAPLIDLFIKKRPNKDKQLIIITESTTEKNKPQFGRTHVHLHGGYDPKWFDGTEYVVGYDNIYFNYKKNKIVIEPHLFRKPFHILNVDRYVGDILKSNIKLRNLFPINYRINYHLRYYDFARNRINLILYDPYPNFLTANV